MPSDQHRWHLGMVTATQPLGDNLLGAHYPWASPDASVPPHKTWDFPRGWLGESVLGSKNPRTRPFSYQFMESIQFKQRFPRLAAGLHLSTITSALLLLCPLVGFQPKVSIKEVGWPFLAGRALLTDTSKNVLQNFIQLLSKYFNLFSSWKHLTPLGTSSLPAREKSVQFSCISLN